MRKLKILQCPVFFLPIRIGGVEVYVHALSRHLIGRGHDVKVLVADYPGEKAYADHDGVPVITYEGFFNTSKKEFKGTVPGRSLPGFIEQLRKEAPDIVHFHQLTNSGGISVFHLEAAKQLGIRVVYTNHLAGFTCQTGKMMYRGESLCDGVIRETRCGVCELARHGVGEGVARLMVGAGQAVTAIAPSLVEKDGKVFSMLSYYDLIRQKRATVSKVLGLVDAFIVVADWYAEVLKRNGFYGPKIHTVRQALPFEERDGEDGHARRPVRDTGVLRLIYVGRIFPEKGLLVLLKAIQQLDEDKVTLDIYGQEDDAPYLAACENIWNGKKNIKWHGFIDNKIIGQIIDRYDALVLPSVVAEMAPLVIQEAFAGGVPVIGSAIGGIKDEIVHGQNGYLFEMGNDGQLREILRKLIDDPSERQKLVVPVPRSFEALTIAVEEIYNSIVE